MKYTELTAEQLKRNPLCTECKCNEIAKFLNDEKPPKQLCIKHAK